MRYKRYIASVLAVGLLLSAVGCGNKSEETTAEAVTEAVTEASQKMGSSHTQMVVNARYQMQMVSLP